MFEGPEHVPYIKFMCELALERKPQSGDYYVNFWAGYTKWTVKPVGQEGMVGFAIIGFFLPLLEEGGGSIWLPLLHQWIAILQAAGGLRNLRIYFPMTVEDDHVAKAYFADDSTFEGRGSSPEEAVARVCWALAEQRASA